MTLDNYMLLLFVSGFLAGVSATLLAIRVPDFIAIVRHIARYLLTRSRHA